MELLSKLNNNDNYDLETEPEENLGLQFLELCINLAEPLHTSVRELELMPLHELIYHVVVLVKKNRKTNTNTGTYKKPVKEIKAVWH